MFFAYSCGARGIFFFFSYCCYAIIVTVPMFVVIARVMEREVFSFFDSCFFFIVVNVSGVIDICMYVCMYGLSPPF